MIDIFFKYKLPIVDGIIEIELPTKGGVTEIVEQNEELFIWALVDANTPLKTKKFIMFPTGKQIEEIHKLRFIKTVVMSNGLVWHIFIVDELLENFTTSETEIVDSTFKH